MFHDPTRVTDGIETSDDPITRAGHLQTSVAHRTGGWKGREAALDARLAWSASGPEARSFDQASPSPEES